MTNYPIPQVKTKSAFNLAFRHLAEKVSHAVGSPYSFFIALGLIILWAITGFYLEFNVTWQLMINTGTTIATFLIVILVQTTQNRDAKSINLKLDELLLGTKSTRNFLLEIEEQSDEEMDALKEEYKLLRKKYMSHLERRHNHRKH
jgi:low affinity Fe/Cu permease